MICHYRLISTNIQLRTDSSDSYINKMEIHKHMFFRGKPFFSDKKFKDL